MKMTKVVPFAMSALLLGARLGSNCISERREATVINAETSEQQVQPIFIKVTGTVENVEVRENATYYTVVDGDNTNIVIANKDSLVLTIWEKKSSFKKEIRCQLTLMPRSQCLRFIHHNTTQK